MGAALKAPAVVIYPDSIATMGEPIEQPGGHCGFGEHGGPFAEGQIGGDDD